MRKPQKRKELLSEFYVKESFKVLGYLLGDFFHWHFFDFRHGANNVSYVGGFGQLPVVGLFPVGYWSIGFG